MRDSYFRISALSRSILCVALALVLLSCEDIVEEDLNGDHITLISPPDGAEELPSVVEFNWNTVEGAIEYRLQVVTPTFDSLLSYRLDTLVSGTRFTHPFSSGDYEWRVRGENSASFTEWAYRRFDAAGTTELTDITPTLTSPPNLFATASDTVTFEWQSVPHAEDYRFVAYFEAYGGTLAVSTIQTTETFLTIPVPEGVLVWSIEAMNSTSTSQIALTNLIVDRTAPIPPSLLFPEDMQVVPTDTIFDFSWTASMDALTSTMDSVLIYSPVGSVVPILGLAEEEAVFDAEQQVIGEYEWQVVGTDAAGNRTESEFRVFSVTQ